MNDKSTTRITHQQLSENLPDVIKVSALGMDERSLQRLQTMFTIIFKGRCQLVEPDEAMVALIDVNEDSVSQNILESSQQDNPALPSIVLVKDSGGSGEKGQNNVRYLEKPLKREAFWQAIVELFERKEQLKAVPKSRLEKASKAKTANSAAALEGLIEKSPQATKATKLVEAKDDESIFFAPDKYLLGYLQKLLRDKHPSNCALKLDFAYKYRIILYPDQQMALTNLTDNHYRNIAITPFQNGQMCKLTVIENADLELQLASSDKNYFKITTDNLLWGLALSTSRGRVPEGTSVNKPLFLHHWPNLPRLRKTPHAMRIASLWIDNPCTLNELVQSLGIAHEDVYSFYSAVHTLGLAGKAKRKSDSMIEGKRVEENKKRGLFSAILRTLKRKPKQ